MLELDLSVVNQEENFAIVADFNKFKKYLIRNKYLNNRFFFNLVFEKKTIKNFYGANIKLKLKQAQSILVLISVICVAGITLSGRIASKTQLFEQNPISLQQNKVKIKPSFLMLYLSH